MSEGPCVWATQFVLDNIFGVRSDDEMKGNPLHPLYVKREPLSPEVVPEFVYLKEGRPEPKHDLFAGVAGVFFTSARFADLLEKFDLGPQPTAEDPTPRRTELHRMPLLKADKETKIADIALMQVSTQKDAFIPEESAISDYAERRDLYMATLLPDSLAVDASALEGPDMWHDRRLSCVVFISDRLHRALEKMKFKPKYTFWRCRALDR